jgi:hypothetical protein
MYKLSTMLFNIFLRVMLSLFILNEKAEKERTKYIKCGLHPLPINNGVEKGGGQLQIMQTFT